MSQVEVKGDIASPLYQQEKGGDEGRNLQMEGNATALSPEHPNEAPHQVCGSLLLRVVCFLGGLVCMALGMVGVVIRGLPTTPFMLLATALFMRCSPRLSRWVLFHPILGVHVHRLRQGLGIPQRVKLYSVGCAWVVMIALAIWVAPNWPIRLVLLGVAGLKTGFMIAIPTYHPRTPQESSTPCAPRGVAPNE